MITYFLILFFSTFLSLSLSALCFYTLKLLNKYDDDLSLHFTRKDSIPLFVFLFLTNLLFFCKNEGQLNFQLIYSIFFLSYLYMTAWIDFHTMKVYRMLGLLFCIIGLIAFLLSKPSLEHIIGLTLYISFLIILSIKNMFGLGDTWIFLCIALFLTCFKYQESTITILLIHNVLSSCLFLIFNLKYIHIKKMRMKKEVAFTPSIGIGAYIMTLLLF